ncbi:hypothetical protein ACTMQP_12635 [Pseudomonas aeruginosa]|uniref:hypothetical protein n=1 Tax=Pseudomonas aeruginosa TaxID=287 RepID=UPI002FE68480
MSMELNKALDLLRGLVSEVEHKTCCHEETHRGGAIWEICDSCGAKWADDEGGKPEFAWPESVEKARAFLATHPAVEQAGGDERAAFELFVRKHCGMPEHIAVNWDAKFTHDAWEGWQARAALAQPSPDHAVQAHDIPMLIASEHANPDYAMGWNDCRAKIIGASSAVQAEQAEAERPEVVARVVHSNPVVLGQCGPLNANDELMTVAQHAASVARWAEMFNRVEQQRDAALAEVERLSDSKGDPVGSLEKCMKVMYERDEHAKRLEVALARVAELEGKLTDWVHEGFRLNEALAVAKAQHSVPDDDMILQIFADNAEHSEQGDEHGYCIVREQHAQAIARKLLAAAPGKEGA